MAAHGLRSVHIMAHGAPGRVSFAAGDWSSETLEDSAGDFAAIGRALDADGDLNLWSCLAGAGAEGADFIADLARATGADIAAADRLVGAAALGGGWELEARSHRAVARPPLTGAGRMTYPGVLADVNDYVYVTGTAGTTAGHIAGGTYYIEAGGVVVGEFSVPNSTTGLAFALNVEVIHPVPIQL